MDHISNPEVRQRFGQISDIGSVLVERKLRWFGHVLRMDPHRLPKQCLFFEAPENWKRPRGGVFKTWNRSVMSLVGAFVRPPHVRSNKWRNWRIDSMTSARDRQQWKALVRDVVHAVRLV